MKKASKMLVVLLALVMALTICGVRRQRQWKRSGGDMVTGL